jgi:hypothetical protein
VLAIDALEIAGRQQAGRCLAELLPERLGARTVPIRRSGEGRSFALGVSQRASSSRHRSSPFVSGAAGFY